MSENNNVNNNNVNRVNYQEDTIDLLDLMVTYVKKWKLLGIVSAVCAVLVFCFLSFFYNKGQRNMSADYEFEFTGIESGYYPDGTTFKYTDFVSYENIADAIASDTEKFGKLDADKLFNDGAVSVKKNFDEDKDKQKIFNGTYNIKLHNNSFQSGEQARDFAEALLASVKDDIYQNANKVYYHTYLDSFALADTFEAKLLYLKAQRDYITGMYATWIESYGEQYVIDGKTLVRYMEDAELAMSDEAYSALDYELQKKQYVYDRTDEQRLVCQLRIELLNDEYEDNGKKIDELTIALNKLREGEVSGTSDLTGQTNEKYYYDTIASLTERQVDIEREIANINIKINNMNNNTEADAYLQKMNVVYDKLDAQTVILEKTVAPAVYNEKTVYNFLTSFETNGGFSSVMGAGVAFILVYIVVGFFAFIMKEKK